jgi:hypothetical protein
MTDRRFPPPWTAEETDACLIVNDHAGHCEVAGFDFLWIYLK